MRSWNNINSFRTLIICQALGWQQPNYTIQNCNARCTNKIIHNIWAWKWGFFSGKNRLKICTTHFVLFFYFLLLHELDLRTLQSYVFHRMGRDAHWASKILDDDVTVDAKTSNFSWLWHFGMYIFNIHIGIFSSQILWQMNRNLRFSIAGCSGNRFIHSLT